LGALPWDMRAGAGCVPLRKVWNSYNLFHSVRNNTIRNLGGSAGMSAQQSLIVELEEAINIGAAEQRVETLRRVTDLFLNDADRLSETPIGVFDDVLCHLIKRAETKALVELSGHLAPVDNSPIEIIRRVRKTTTREAC
jgi:hypothetical protein